MGDVFGKVKKKLAVKRALSSSISSKAARGSSRVSDSRTSKQKVSSGETTSRSRVSGVSTTTSSRRRSSGRSSSSSRRRREAQAKAKAQAEAKAKAEARAKAEAKVKADAKAKALVEANKKLAEKKAKAEKLKKQKELQAIAFKKAQRELALRKARERLAKKPESQARNILTKVAETGKVTKAQRDKFKELGFNTQVLTQTVVANKIISDVQRTGKITPQQRKAFKTTGFDSRVLTKTAVDKIQLVKADIAKQKEYNSYLNKRNNLTRDISKARGLLFSGKATGVAKKNAEKLLIRKENELTKLQKTNIGREVEPLIRDNKRIELKKLREAKAKLTKAVRDDMFKTINSVARKVNTGQSITPKDIKTFSKQFDKGISLADITRGMTLEKKKLVKELIAIDKYRIGNIDIKKELKTKKMAPRVTKFVTSVAAGVVEFGSEITLPVKIAYNYGLTIPKRSAQERRSQVRILTNDIVKLYRGGVSMGSFIKNHPYKAAVIVGAIATEVGKSYKAEFQKDPVKAMTKALLDLAGVDLLLFDGLLTKLDNFNPALLKLKNGKFTIRKAPVQTFKVRGKTRLLKARVQKPSIKRPFSSVADFLKGRKAGQFKKFTKDPGLILKEQFIKTGAAKSLAEQAKIAGTEVTAVNTAADQLTSWLKREKLVRKPIPGEADFPKTIKDILNKFDNGVKITRKQFANVNKWLQKNVAPNITLLERSLYADPASGLRTSRLGIKDIRNANLADILRGNFKFKSPKPQVLIFENAKVAKFPKKLNDVKKKLLAGKKLNTKETNRLIAWQIQTGSGKFKPIGSTIFKGGIELEITLAPGEYIKRIKKVGVTKIDGVKVDFVTAEVWKPPKTIKDKLSKAKMGKLTESEILDLDKLLSKKLGTKVQVDAPNIKRRPRARGAKDLPVLRLDRGFIKIVKRATRVAKRATTKVKRTVTKRVTAKTKRVTPKRAKATAKRVTTKTKRATAKRTVTKTKRVTTKRTTTPSPRTTTTRKTTTRKVTARRPSPRPTPIIKVTKIIPKPRVTPRLDLDSKRLKDKVALFIGKYRERQNPRKPFNNRTNKVVVKTLRIKDTKNRALKKVSDLADKKAIRSIDIKLVGITDKKKKDIGSPKVLTKFRTTKSKLKDRLNLVEKAKHTLDKKTERRELASLKKKKKGTTKKPSKKKVVKKKKSKK